MKTNNYSQDELGLIISEKYNRIVDNASTIKYNSKYYIPVNPNTGEVICFLKKTQCTFIITYHGDYWCNIEGNYYQMIEIENRDTVMIKENEIMTKIRFKKISNIFLPKAILGEKI